MAHASTTTACTASLFRGSVDVHGNESIAGRNPRDDKGKRCGKKVGIYWDGEEETSSLGERTGFVAQVSEMRKKEEGANSRDYERHWCCEGVDGWMGGWEWRGFCQI